MSTSSSSSSSRILSATVIGSGPSSGVPIVKCFVNPTENGAQTCQRCIDGLHNEAGMNNRNNPSFLIRVGSGNTRNESGDDIQNIIIDCGKTMRNSILKFFYPKKITQLHELIITHNHCDAYCGLLDSAPLCAKTAAENGGSGVPVYSDQKTLKAVSEIFPTAWVSYNKNKNKNSNNKTAADDDENAENNNNSTSTSATSPASISSFVTLPLTKPLFTPRLVTSGQNFIIGTNNGKQSGVEVMPIYVLHGVNYYCLAFILSLDATGKLFDSCDTLVYISDTGDVTEKSRNEILKYKTKILILDLLKMENSYTSHFGHDNAVEEAGKIGAEKTYFIGYSHSVDTDRCRKNWQEKNVGDSFFFCHDGMEVFSREK